ncbi:hypothetical protein C8Q69DRAFT_448043 [Paecilomyces variotii]|uniref:GPI anchored protein n=1 Tax=Byssochlamys spectabilis TaxID=264951 RepID=A0A443HJF0_BYSSP|nr:hypothetical protein C8Q69DRAFT_448043 [Paecilomyces variotii]RWQ91960.1 hypothetical protein C8Q69DRAFT_448043 [Paecilomyces variotii]
MTPLSYYPLYTILLLSSIPQTVRSENGDSSNSDFTIVNGQIFTPGLAILDSPQPFTPLGGDTLQIAIDISGDGRIPLSNPSTSPTVFHNITIFLTSYTTIHNFTISNNTSPPPATTPPAFIGPILSLEPSSTVKHIDWFWPACLVGNGAPQSTTTSSSSLGTGTGTTSARGEYNISIHQSFRLNGSEFYTVFDLPISVTDDIPERAERVECPFLENILLPPEEIRAGTDTLPTQPFLGGGVSISFSGTGAGMGSLGSGEGSSSGEGGSSSGTGTGGKDGDGDLTALLAEGSGRVRWSTSMMVLVGAAMYFIMLL